MTKKTRLATSTPRAATTAYLFVHFTGEENTGVDEELSSFISLDGTHWKNLRTFSQLVKWIDCSICIIGTTMIQTDEGWWVKASNDDGITLERAKNPYAATHEVTRTDDEKTWSYFSTLREVFGQECYSSHYLEGPELFFLITPSMPWA